MRVAYSKTSRGNARGGRASRLKAAERGSEFSIPRWYRDIDGKIRWSGPYIDKENRKILRELARRDVRK